MRIIEQNLVGKHSQETCEDGIVITQDFVAVIDGSTSKTTHRFRPEMKNGRLCMLVISDFIRQMPSDITLRSFCDGVTTAIHALYPDDDTVERLHSEERLCASAVIYSNHRKEIWMIGDCQCMVDGQLYENSKPCEEIIAQRRASTFDEALRQHPDMVHDGHIVHDYARDAILSNLIKSMEGENKTYAVIDGFPIYREGIKRITTNMVLSKVQKIVLASDGYPFLKSTLKESEEALHRQLLHDPYNIHTFLATKGLMEGNQSFDDRAYVSFEP